MGRPSSSRPVQDRSPRRHPRQRHVCARSTATTTFEVESSGWRASLTTVARRTISLPPVSIKPPPSDTGEGLLSGTTISTSQERSQDTDLNIGYPHPNEAFVQVLIDRFRPSNMPGSLHEAWIPETQSRPKLKTSTDDDGLTHTGRTKSY
ncbi:hypothetical protein BHM03_00059179 [Ensete ventricosum]|uniref:Uncharacterized protein n=1 Tax=Ensete ventricosum TaxID=4639 RepID=A0A445MMP4_ENSVE|nr:hypothetical protein BHM03_00059179 [Ensete ventricosum]